jgi:TetR/AcrR family transcriptional regulator
MNDTKSRNADATKAAILAAAEELFAERGFSGASIAKISEKSGASGPLIIFHFKDKRGLYEAVKTSIVERYSKCLPEPIEEADGLPGLLQNIMRAMFLYYQNNPTMMRIAKWATLEGDHESWDGESEWHHRYVGHIRAAQKRGAIRDDISPFRALVMISGAIHVWWEYRNHFLRDLDQADNPEGADETYFAELETVLLRGLSPTRRRAGRLRSRE